MDDGRRPACVDYEFIAPDGTLVGLEVSRITDRSLRRLAASAADRDWWSLRHARHEWHIGVRADACIKRLHENCDGLLAELEQHDVLHFSYSVVPVGEASSAAHSLLELGIVTAVARGESTAATVHVSPSWYGHGFNPGAALNRRVELEAQRNADKLAASPYDRCQLFLWTDALVTSLTGSLVGPVGREYIREPPLLPDGVEAVWIAPDPFPTLTDRGPVWPHSPALVEPVALVQHLWRVEPPHTWRCLGDINVTDARLDS